jgi:hypothetical protein
MMERNDVEGNDEAIHEARTWRDDGWTAQVVKNEDGDGWAVAMYQDGQSEPALVGPWTMGRNKVDPKPLDNAAFSTLVKTASEVLRRHEQQLYASLHKSVAIAHTDGIITVTLNIIPDEDDPHAVLAATDTFGEELARRRVEPTFKLTRISASNWIDSGFKR